MQISASDMARKCRHVLAQITVIIQSVVCYSEACVLPERIQFRLAVLAFCCRNHKALSYLADELHWADEAESRHRLQSGSYPCLIVPRTRLSTIGNRSFRVTVARALNQGVKYSIEASSSIDTGVETTRSHLAD